jgi:aspartate kinase
LTPRAQDKFLSYGELISTAIVSAALNANQIKSDLMDARKLVITDDHFTGANPIQRITYSKIKQAIQPKIKTGSVPVFQGFIGSTKKGATTTLGFEGSDLTACLVGAAMKTSDVQIWKDVSGIMTADPMMVRDAKTVKTISFDEVGELTYFGAKVFYSRAVEPARQASIPIHIYNSKAPDKTGTEVTLKPKPCRNLLKSIAYKSGLLLVHIQPNPYISKNEFNRSIFEIMEHLCIDVKIYHMAKNEATLVVENSNSFETFLKKANGLGSSTNKEGKASVSLVGENMRNRQDIPNLVIHILKNQTIDLISTGVSPINVTIVIDEKDLKSVINKLHVYFFKTVDTSVFE